MIRRRYRIEANLRTLHRFVGVLAAVDARHFIQRVSPDVNEEYYYVVVIGPTQTHDLLKERNFRDSIALK